MSQTKIFNFFPGSVPPSSIIKILSYFANRYKNNYITNGNLWINWLYYEISNSRQEQCLKIDTRDVNELGPPKFRTQADSRRQQICYYKRNKKDTCFNSFLAVRKKISSPFEINFSIVKVTDSANRKDIIYSEISDELSEFKNGSIQQTAQRISESVSVRNTKDQTDGDENIHLMNESAKSQDFFEDNNTMVGKRYTTTGIKSRNFLSNIAYVGVKKKISFWCLLPCNQKSKSILIGQKIGRQKQVRDKWACLRNFTGTFARKKLFVPQR